MVMKGLICELKNGYEWINQCVNEWVNLIVNGYEWVNLCVNESVNLSVIELLWMG